ncbi:Expansin-like A1 [Bienertia sinuspersici]
MAAFSHFIFIMLIISYAVPYDRCVHQSKAAYNYTCGYGSLPLNYGGFLVARFSSCFKDGAECGAFSDLCTKLGTNVMLMDLNTNTHTNFVLSNKAFKAMAKPGKDRDILKLGIADVEYKRSI